MPDRIRHNIKYLVSNLNVYDLLEDLLESAVLDVDEYKVALAKEEDKLELSKYVVRRMMLEKTTEQVDAFLEVVERYQPDVVKHVAQTMEDRQSTGAANSAGAGATTTASRKAEKVKTTSSTSSSAASSQYNKQVTGNTTGQHNTTSNTKNGQSNTTGSTTQSQPTSLGKQTTDITTQQTTKLLPDKDVHFIGRDDIVMKVAQTVLTPTPKSSDGVKAQSLVAPAGFGKTSVAIGVGHRCQEAGVLVEFFDLRGVADVSTVESMVRARLDRNITAATAQSERKKWDSSKCDKAPILVILDNAEDAIQSGVGKDFQLQDIVKWIVGLHGNVHVLLTSRILVGAYAAQFKLEQHRLDRLPDSSAVHLLQSLCTKGSVSSMTARQLVHHCGCVPLALCITAGLLQGGHFTADMLLATFRKMGLDVFRDDDLKPNDQIMRLLELAYNMLQPEGQNTLHALSQITTSFSSDAACALVGLAENDVSMVHLLRFYPLIKICFLEFDTMSQRYSLQPFIAEFGRYKCPEIQRDEHGRRLCNHYLGQMVNGRFSKRSCSPELAMELSVQLQQELPNIQHAAQLSVDVLTDSDFAVAGVLMSSAWGNLLRLSFGERFLERMASLKQIPYYQRVAAGCTLFNLRTSIFREDAGGIETLERAVAILDELCQNGHRPTCEESERNILFANIAIQSTKVVFCVLSDCLNDSKGLGSKSTAELEEAWQMITGVSEKCQLTDAEDRGLQVMELAFATLLGKNLPNSKSLEDLYSQSVTARYLSENGETWCNIALHDLLRMVLEMKMASAVQWNVPPFFLKMLGVSVTPQKQAHSALPRLSRAGNEDTFQMGLLQQQFADNGDDSRAGILLRALLPLHHTERWHRLCANHPTPLSLISSTESYQSIVFDYIRTYCNGSRSNGESETHNLGLFETSTVQCCLQYAKCLVHHSTWTPRDCPADVLVALKSLIKECTDRLPTNSARGVSVSGIVYIIPGTAVHAVATLFALHQQSKRGDVTIEHHIELLEWRGVAPACFVCYNLDTVEACPHCGMAWLCAKHKIGKYQSEHAQQQCAMLRVLRQRLQRRRTGSAK